MADKMRAVVFRRHGGAEVLEEATVDRPVPARDEALIQVKACSVNHLDIWTREGMPGVTVSMPHILGCDVAGVIRHLGRPTRGLKAGQAVVVAPGISCGHCPFCKAGRDSLCPRYHILGFQVNGGYAEYVTVPIRNLVPISTTRWNFTEWAATPLVFLTAWHMLLTRGELRPGETVLIHAAGSGIGSAAIQLAKWRGATVITTVGSEEKAKKARALGADQVINYKTRDFAKEVLRLTGDRGADLVFEHIGPATWAGSLRSIAKGGRMVTCGATSGREVAMDLRFFFAKELQISGCYMGGRGELDQVLKLVARGTLKPVVDTVFPLRDAAAAHARMESRQQFGKLLLVP